MAKNTKGPLKRKDKRSGMEKFAKGNPIAKGIIFSKAKQMLDGLTKGELSGRLMILDCVRIGMNSGMKKGLEAEVVKFEKLILTDEEVPTA